MFTLGLVAVRHLERHPCAGGVPHPAGLRRRDDGAGRAAHAGAHLRQVRAGPRHELRRHSRPDRPDARARRRRAHRRLLALARDLLRQHSDRPARACTWSTAICPTIASEHTHPLDVVGLHPVRLRHRAAVLRARGLRRAHAERPRDARAAGALASRCSPATGCTRRALRIRCCGSACFASAPSAPRWAAASSRGLGIGGMPFLFPLLYQVGLGLHADPVRPADHAAGASPR